MPDPNLKSVIEIPVQQMQPENVSLCYTRDELVSIAANVNTISRTTRKQLFHYKLWKQREKPILREAHQSLISPADQPIPVYIRLEMKTNPLQLSGNDGFYESSL